MRAARSSFSSAVSSTDAVPNAMLGLVSTITQASSRLSARGRHTCGSPERAVMFQSM
jgi:hypothetical protein